jgi:DNA polymerase-1
LLNKLHNFVYSGNIIDTLVYARTIWPDVRDKDFTLVKQGKIPQKLVGSHSLRAWGHRLGVLKGEVNSETGFSAFTEEMLHYCVQDVAVNQKLYERIEARNFNQEALDLETELHTLLIEQEEHGFPFDVKAASSLYARLAQRKADIEKELQDTFEPTIIEMKTKTKTIPFNPASRQQIADRLMKRGWQPEAYTDSGEPKVDETVLSGIDMS